MVAIIDIAPPVSGPILDICCFLGGNLGFHVMKDTDCAAAPRFDRVLISSLVLAHFAAGLFRRIDDDPVLATAIYAVCLIGPAMVRALYMGVFAPDPQSAFRPLRRG